MHSQIIANYLAAGYGAALTVVQSIGDTFSSVMEASRKQHNTETSKSTFWGSSTAAGKWWTVHHCKTYQKKVGEAIQNLSYLSAEYCSETIAKFPFYSLGS